MYNRSRESASGSRVIPCVYNRSRESASGSRVLPSVCTIEVENQCQGVAFYPVCAIEVGIPLEVLSSWGCKLGQRKIKSEILHRLFWKIWIS